MDEDDPPSVNFIPCVKWVRRGVARSHPIKVELSKQDLDEVIRQTRANLHVNDDEDSGTENDTGASATNPGDEFNMDAYDAEDEAIGPKLEDVVDIEEEDGYVAADDDVDSEADDDLIKPSDNLIVVGHVEGDASILEVFVYNEDEGSMYVHHDILLPSIPLAMEWLNYDPENVHVAGNLCAVGSMSPIIEVWDLDLINSIEPAYKLGRKRNRKKNLPAIGHTDAVLALSWNTNLTHILASGSVDQKVILWDLEVKSSNAELIAFAEKIQSLQWHPTEGHGLLTGSADKTVKAWDCRSSEYKSWNVTGEVEHVSWNFTNSSHFLACDDQGYIYHFDVRTNTPVWSHKIYDGTVTGLHVSPVVPGLLITVGESGLAKVWDIQGPPSLIAEKPMKVGKAQSLDVAPESPFTVAVGGDNRNHNFMVQSFGEIDAVKNRFNGRTFNPTPVFDGIPVAGPSTTRDPSPVKVREKRPRSAERALIAKKKSKKLNKVKKQN